MVSEEILLIITKDVTGQASEEEKNLLRDWLSESKENSDLFHSYKEAYLNGKYEPRARNKETTYEALSHRLQFKKNNLKGGRNKRFWRSFQISQAWLKVASIVLVLITTSFIIYKTRDLWAPVIETDTTANEVIVKSNPRGIKSLVTLPDGSKVKLNSESHLEYYSDFEHERSVKLIGEAFFEVVKDSLRPFYVNSGDLRIRVLGTSFNVQAFPFEKSINVALVTGKVLIERKEGLEIKHVDHLSPNEMLIYDHQSAKYDITRFDATNVIGWKDGKLHLDEPDFRTVIKKLERWYGVEIVVEPTADLSGSFDVTYINQPLDVVLKGIGFMSGFEYERQGKKVIIK